MRRLVPAAALLLLSASLASAAPVRRLALVVGANQGAADRVPLRYAVADAERFADLVSHIGGVALQDRVVLRDPSRRAFTEALGTVGARVGEARAGASRVEVVVYFSGHADDRGLMLGRETVPYRELRDSIQALRADVGITILDACASGAITRLKGGTGHPAFLSASPGDVQGYAFLTSSSETEAAQESERLGGSFFTHALVSALRGAADATGDGRVTPNEAYQFAFHETLAQTTSTEHGAQHPSYDIKMSGSGDVVMTDLRDTTSTLVLGEGQYGRFYVLDADRQLVAELHKPLGRRIELGLEPGSYDVFVEQDSARRTASVTLADGEKRELTAAELRATKLLPSRRRGPEERDALLDGRLRAQLGVTFEPGRTLSGARYSMLTWNKPYLAYEFSFGTGHFSGGEVDILLGARYYPKVQGRFRPYAGLLAGAGEARAMNGTERVSRNQLIFAVPAGVDVFLGRRFAVDLATRSYLTINGQRGFEAFLGVGFMFGGRSRK
ncbi:MAG: caspase family protein [Vicinamibacteria bacterium]